MEMEKQLKKTKKFYRTLVENFEKSLYILT